MPVCVTSGTIDRLMCTACWKFCLVVIKTLAPGNCSFAVAVDTVRAETFCPVINRRRTFKIASMAGKTFHRRFAKPQRDVALPAFRAFVFPLQRKRRFAVIEIHLRFDFLP